ncbi:MAG TPA: gamma-glutamyl-gamma-aminobutyrate hydrolase family protein [Polyangiaceae bacterium]|jgi:CTP synthase (UTP-ammonia lyase)
MATTTRIGLIGDASADVRAHAAIPEAIERVRGDADVALEWLPTARLVAMPDADLAGYQGLWCVPGSPYASMEGALRAIRFARTRGTPFLGTCGGFQHAVIEIARDVLGLRTADHTESNPDAEVPIIHRLSCSLVGVRGRIHLVEGSLLRGIYGAPDAVEGYHCNFGVNPTYESLLDSGAVRVAARDDAGEVRAIELRSHRFFLGALFQPELSALEGRDHPLVRAFVLAARSS